MGILKSMGIFDPSEEELKKLGMSRFTYEDNWVACAKLSGTFLFNRTFTVVYHSTRILALFSMIGFIYGAFMEGDKENSLESAQYMMIIFVMYGGCCGFALNHDHFHSLLRLIDKGGFDYEGTLTREAEEEIAHRRAQTRRYKEGFKKLFRVIFVMATLCVCGQKPLGRLIRGRGKKLVDGENNLIWSGAFGMYWPFADNWFSYTFALMYNNTVSAWIVLGNVGYVSAFLFTGEELLCEFSIVSYTFRHCVQRAKVLHDFRINNSFNTKNEQKNVDTMDDCLKYCVNLSIKHHHEALGSLYSLKAIMHFPLFILIVGWAIITCLSVYLLLSDEVSLDFKLPLPVLIFAEFFIAFIYCYYGQRFTNACEEIGSSIYEDPEWTEYSVTLKSYISIIRGYCDVPNGLSAGGFSTLDHITFSNMTSTAYSYIGFLLST